MPLERSLITRTSLQDVGRLLQFSEAKDWDGFGQYSNKCNPASLVFLDNINAVWDKKYGIWINNSFAAVRAAEASLLHRWLVFDALESASSVPQQVLSGAAAITTARAWVLNPSLGNKIAVARAAANARAVAVSVDYEDEATYYRLAASVAYSVVSAANIPAKAAYDAAYAAAEAASAATQVTYSAAYSGARSAVYRANIRSAAYSAAVLRIQVLAAIQDYLPEPV